jgi:serine/threonine-protein kinase HipA
MERLFVFADFNWLGKAELVGELCYEKLRGSDCYAFKFDENWLKVHAGIKLSEDINNYPGMQYTQPGSDIFGCFSDALPDRWGRTLLKRSIITRQDLNIKRGIKALRHVFAGWDRRGATC